MTTTPHRLHLAASEESEPEDLRVTAVLDVLSGEPLAQVATQRQVEPVLLRRWLRAFVDAGSAQLRNQPEPDVARQRDRFLAAFAHELRTPLTVAQGWAAMLADGDLPPALVESTAETLDTALARLAARVRDVEHLAAASMGRLQPTLLPTTPRALADAAGLDLVAGDLDDLGVLTDPELASRALHDLAAAAALPPEPTTLRLVAARSTDWLELHVERVADPIDTTTLQALFEPFDVNDDGTGVSIGLYLARALLVLLGGTIGVEQHPDHGRFWLRLPLTPVRRTS